MAEQALENLRVVEWGNFISAPYCTKLLADMGAEVIKVELPDTGDEARKYGPFPGDAPDSEKSGLFLYLNISNLSSLVPLSLQQNFRVFFDILHHLACAAYDSQQRFFGYMNGKVGLKTKPFVKTFEQCAAAGKHDTAV